MDTLRETDKVAYVRFASVYRQFKDINDLLDEVRTLFEHQNDNALIRSDDAMDKIW
jgi:transcriptional repressor NrdR